ncbi:non-hydrolyzing UDP-N-acetylglucosamine 2-epimerase [Haloarcula onubensis]|uniref:UDP-N-acetylglucosamine 2-epimerase (Non-hydrolyzing) n=1 Tax=Haloarcula onubensis TaxID=2950539 RepID=A0ABU2FLI5_9EURY|nr:UDP-N-acetylglucosamine 2-epimerase (non-hydrolyzing) [Halomicroarcula sp. S3CR25-11]MDS0281603.1 UDP-N-acetylglucosamine 2-epimerase (non-hydrolyzing) [Halomicroarcula sp. S3CR25-11]
MTPRIVFVLGTRPEIVKLAPIIRACDRAAVDYSVVHTGQHYSERLDGVFFDDLELPTPEYNLEVGSGDHAAQTGEMVARLGEVFEQESPDVVVVQGDTNSAFAGGVVASKRDATLAHVEAGLRSFDREMPEELNRVLVDHAADHLFAPTDEAADQLRTEAIPDRRIEVTGNTVVDAVRQHVRLAREKSDVLADLDLRGEPFALLTAHRPGNVDDRERFQGLLDGVAAYAAERDLPVVYPVHPRSREKIDEFDLDVPDAIRCVDPLNFLDFLRLESAAAVAFTDSGGVQEETCVLGTPCVTIRDSTERPETLTVGSNVLAEPTPESIVDATEDVRRGPNDWEAPFGDGHAAERILETLGVDAPALSGEVPV